ncbi:MAG: DNA methyltransferase [Candidatus Aenigmarchaeota archaeon]|nr:DNA methyltransferase [Candidatus Aenigmarchaeota archaeon]
MSYEEFREQLVDRIEEKLEWRDLATFVPNKKTPIYNWFYYKEGFAKELVEKLLEMFEIKEGATALDPFCGSGTTLLVCKEKSIKSVGYDVLPVSVFATRVKTADYDTDLLRENMQIISRARFAQLNTKGKFPGIFYRAFSKYALEDIAFLRSMIIHLDREVREFFVLALMNAAIKCSYTYKDGSVIKIKKKHVAPLRKMFRHVVSKMIRDIEKSPRTEASIRVELEDARSLDLDDNSVDVVITSPPYLNNIDYTKVYSIEEYFIYGEPVPGVRAYIGLQAKDSDFLSEIPLPIQARLYFEDMNKVLQELYRVLKKDGHAAIVVGNGYVRRSVASSTSQNASHSEDVNEVIESDIILAYLAAELGFEVEKILVLNKRFALEDRTVKKGVLRESLLILKK